MLTSVWYIFYIDIYILDNIYDQKACRMVLTVHLCDVCVDAMLLLYVFPRSKHSSPHIGGTPSAANSTKDMEPAEIK